MKQISEKKAYASPEVELVLVEAGLDILQASAGSIETYGEETPSDWF